MNFISFLSNISKSIEAKYKASCDISTFGLLVNFNIGKTVVIDLDYLSILFIKLSKSFDFCCEIISNELISMIKELLDNLIYVEVQNKNDDILYLYTTEYGYQNGRSYCASPKNFIFMMNQYLDGKTSSKEIMDTFGFSKSTFYRRLCAYKQLAELVQNKASAYVKSAYCTSVYEDLFKN